MSLQDKRIALLESRLGEQIAGLLTREGALPLHAPALAEVPDTDLDLLAAFLDACIARPPDMFVFQTGVGTRALFEAAEQLGRGDQLSALMARAQVAVRGPKPTAVLRGKRVRIDLSAGDPHTTRELEQELDSIPLSGKRVVVQRYGESNLDLDHYLRERDAEVTELPLYRWALPADTRPLLALLDALDQHAVDAVVFTSQAQVRNLIEFAQTVGRGATLRTGLALTKIVSIGPVCSRALEAVGLKVDAEAQPPKIGPLIALLRARL
jgi:uroporphyrinogen-III synthase